MTLADLESLSEIFSSTKHRAAALRQLSLLFYHCNNTLILHCCGKHILRCAVFLAFPFTTSNRLCVFSLYIITLFYIITGI